MKIMNHFGNPYAVLHDTDMPKASNGNANPAWTANEKILEAVAASPVAGRIRLAASVVDFEQAIFGKEATKDKPYNTVKKIREDDVARSKVVALLDYLLFQSDTLPTGVIAWTTVDDLEKVVSTFISA
ncbi:MAG: hypothetical protein P4L58_03370 [Candidatus Pacebacteria bacterium]|nr:hypothetical protein [Candidatus Paceibacterota bacterium]